MRARLTLEAGHAVPAVCNLEGTGVVSIGRNKKNTIVVHDQHASRWHAEIVLEDGRWWLRETGTTNGTRVEGIRVRGMQALEDGVQIRVGDTSWRFDLLDEKDTDPDEENVASLVPATAPPSISHSTHTVLQTDELNLLLEFMNYSMKQDSAHELIQSALQTIARQTNASLTGYLNLDPNDPMPRLVHPDHATLNAHLSRKLTAEMQRRQRTVWLSEKEGPNLSTDSLIGYGDAYCVPVNGQDAPLGAIHVYRMARKFTERDINFTQALVGYLAQSLEGLRARRALEADNLRLQQRVAAGPDDDMVGESLLMRHLRQQIRRLAERPNMILIVGESGSGKELVAQRLHQLSSRNKGPLVIVNCAAIAASMPEAELFGHKAGSFTGAVHDRAGFFAQADEGTLFLDEIGELSEECQAKLLRVLESHSFRPVGAEAEVQSDVRILAATNRDLEEECRAGRFRWDLFYRLGVTLKVPPLRERGEDISALVAHFLSKLAREYKRNVRLTPGALKRLEAYRWPGNVRQLRSVLEHAIANSEGTEIQAEELHLGDANAGVPNVSSAVGLNLESLERWAICQALQQTRGNNSQAAHLLGIHRDTLLAKIRKYEIDRDRESGRK